MHGLGCWFDLHFNGSQKEILLSTSPDFPTTHWYQCRLLLNQPLAVNKGQAISGKMKFQANEKFSYYIYLTASIDGTAISSTNKINLHDQMYHYLYDQSGRWLCFEVAVVLAVIVVVVVGVTVTVVVVGTSRCLVCWMYLKLSTTARRSLDLQLPTGLTLSVWLWETMKGSLRCIHIQYRYLIIT